MDTFNSIMAVPAGQVVLAFAVIAIIATVSTAAAVWLFPAGFERTFVAGTVIIMVGTVAVLVHYAGQYGGVDAATTAVTVAVAVTALVAARVTRSNK
jgi:hypothetical protein